jgi:hypothetical protein
MPLGIPVRTQFDHALEWSVSVPYTKRSTTPLISGSFKMKGDEGGDTAGNATLATNMAMRLLIENLDFERESKSNLELLRET